MWKSVDSYYTVCMHVFMCMFFWEAFKKLR